MFRKKKYFKLPEPEPEIIIPEFPELTYSRYENIVIDDNFIYTNEELSGNTSYDIYLLYIKNDIHNVKSYLDLPVEENIIRIKSNSDIKLIKNDKGYEISNGRHRLVYLKSVYGLESYLNRADKERFTITALVEYTLDDKIEQELKIIKQQNNNIRFLKINEYNDDPSIFIIINNKTYVVNSYEELLDFKGNKDKYLYIERTKIVTYEYDEMIKSIYFRLGTKLFDLSITDIIEYLDKYSNAKKETINIHKLYQAYRILMSYTNIQKLKQESLQNINIDEALFTKKYCLGLELNRLLDSNDKEYNILELVRSIPRYNEYSDEYLMESIQCANKKTFKHIS